MKGDSEERWANLYENAPVAAFDGLRETCANGRPPGMPLFSISLPVVPMPGRQLVAHIAREGSSGLCSKAMTSLCLSKPVVG